MRRGTIASEQREEEGKEKIILMDCSIAFRLAQPLFFEIVCKER